jgi:hypothetical protein
MRLLLVGAAALLMADTALAFQETTVGGQQPGQAAPSGDLPKASKDSGKGLDLSVPEAGVGKSTGTEVRIPGLGTVGVLPKLDFGLELLYGASESKGLPNDRTGSEPDDLKIRGTLKHRF